MKEIGSEFHKVKPDSGQGLSFLSNGTMVFSGRTAIETVLKELPDAKKALLPSYCCNSMIEPFTKAGISVSFYPVNYRDGLNIEIDIPYGTDILLWCNYFGFRTPMPDMEEFLGKGGVIIEDITHSLFSDQYYHVQSDYLVASIRKWEPIYSGGYCEKIRGNLQHKPDSVPSEEYVRLKSRAMGLKSEYLADLNENKKSRFLSMFSDCNRWLEENYSGLLMDGGSREYLANIDVEEQKKRRRKNAGVLYRGLKGKVRFLFSEDDMGCPLFVPILLKNRDEVKKGLIDNKIYCPVHWPRPDKCESNLYKMELSLICDQRYDEHDMERIISVINKII